MCVGVYNAHVYMYHHFPLPTATDRSAHKRLHNKDASGVGDHDNRFHHFDSEPEKEVMEEKDGQPFSLPAISLLYAALHMYICPPST